MTLWLIGGTQESGLLAWKLREQGIPTLVTITTEAARQLYPSEGLRLWVGAIPPAAMGNWLQQQGIGAILDASHPFAQQVSLGAMQAAAQSGLPYLRFERPALGPGDLSLDDLLGGDRLTGQRVLLILGYRLLAQFQPWQQRATLFARILPSSVALAAALEAGFSGDRLIALRPPVSVALERALWQQWDLSLVVAKASGQAGGEAVKRQVAAELNIPLLILRRPAIAYPAQTSAWEDALDFARRTLTAAAPYKGLP